MRLARVLVPFGVLAALVLFSCYHNNPPWPCDPTQPEPCLQVHQPRDAGTQ